MEGKIVCLRSNQYTLYSNGKIIQAKATGLFRHHEITPKVGDLVEWEMMNDAEGYITKVFPRHNELVRPPISNVDQAVLVFSLAEPELNLNLLDRLLAIFSYYQIDVVVLMSKTDLLKDVEETNNLIDYYKGIGYKIITYNINDSDTKCIGDLKEIFAQKVSVLVGQSGVGKSSLLNMLFPDLKLLTQEISLSLNRGKHTTRHVELHQLSFSGNQIGWIADTPGFGIVDFDESMSDVEIAQNFWEFFELSKKCRYQGCSHQNEPNCAIKAALSQNQVLPSRYQNYLSFCQETKKKSRKW